MHWFYRVCYLVVWTLLRALSGWQVKGLDNVPRQGPLIIVANHMTMLDPPVLAVSLGRPVQFMAKTELFSPRLVGHAASALGVIPVNRGRIDRGVLRAAERILADGRVLVVFPEGQRSRNRALQRAFSGAALIALRSGAPVLPAAITGTELVRGKTWWLRRPRIVVTFGRPFNLPVGRGRSDREECTDHMMRQIARLLPAKYRGVYASEGTG